LVPSAPGNDWADVVAANVCSFALKKDGSLWAWGVNNFCRLGIGTSINAAVPVRVGPSTNWSKIRAGGVSGAGIQNDGSLWIWGGSPEFGNHAKNFTNNLAIPTRMTSATNWVDVAVDYNLWLAVKTDGTLWAFGKDAHAYTGGLPSDFATPTRIGTNSDWMSVSTGRFGHFLRKRDGTFWRLGQFLGPGASDQLAPLDLPKDALDGDTCGGAVAVITRDGEVRAWGSALGERTSKVRLLDWLSNHGFRSGQRQWEKNQRDNPWSIHNIDPD
jgi:alpha-tubulin suppressor-like RCC1 family protein